MLIKYKSNYLSYLFFFIFLTLTGQSLAVTATTNTTEEKKKTIKTKTASKYTKSEKITHPKDIQYIIDKGKIVVAMYHIDTPPFYYVDEKGKLTGTDVELIKGFANLLGVEIEFRRDAKFINNVVDMVTNNEADLGISKLSITFSRVKRALFTKPYIDLHQGLLVNRLLLARQLKGRSDEETIQNLQGKIGVIAKSSYVKYANQRFKKAEVVGYPRWQDAVNAVLRGQIIAAYRDEVEIKKIIRDNPDTALKVLSVVLKDAKDPKGIVVSAEKPHLKTLLDFYIDLLDLNLTADKVLNEYDNVIRNIEIKTK